MKTIKYLKMVSIITVISVLMSLLVSCEITRNDDNGGSAVIDEAVTAEYDEEDIDISYSADNAEDNVNIVLSDESVSITSGGYYIISGTLSDGQIIVNSSDKNAVHLVLDNAEINCDNGSAIVIQNAEKTIITTTKDSVNTLSDGKSYSDTSEDAPDACVYSKDDLTFNGEGTLNINGNYNHAVHTTDDLKITAGTYVIESVNDALKGKDSVSVNGGDITVKSSGDGIQSSNDEDTAKGNVIIDGGDITIVSTEDGIQAEHSLLVSGGNVDITTGSGASSQTSSNSGFTKTGGGWGGGMMQGGDTQSSTTDGGKGIKAGSLLTISGGNITVNASDDAVHSDGSIEINGGEITVSSTDDGIHAEANLVIKDGMIDILTSYEGIEGQYITIDGGHISLRSSDDGINATGGNTSSSQGGFSRGGMGTVQDCSVVINGGYIYLNADGDGFDSNATAEMNGGELYVDGPTSSANGAIDYETSFTINGGILVAVGASGMAMNTSGGNQCSALLTINTQSGNETITLKDSSGYELLSYTPSKSYNSVVISTPEMKTGMSYTLYIGDTAVSTFTQSSTRYSANGQSGGFGGGGMGGNVNPGSKNRR